MKRDFLLLARSRGFRRNKPELPVKAAECRESGAKGECAIRLRPECTGKIPHSLRVEASLARRRLCRMPEYEFPLLRRCWCSKPRAQWEQLLRPSSLRLLSLLPAQAA